MNASDDSTSDDSAFDDSASDGSALDELARGLPDVIPPGDLLEKTLGRLEEEALIVDDPALPAGAFRSTLDRLEDEGLMAPRPGLWRRAAALLFIGALGGLVGGYLLRGDRVVENQVVVEKPVDRIIEKEVPGPIRTVVEQQSVPFFVEIPVEVIREKEVVVEKPVEVIRERIVEKPVEVVRTVQVPAAPAGVDEVRDVERWSFASTQWLPVEIGDALEPGSLVRGVGGRARIVVEGRPYRLGRLTHVLTPRGLDPLPPDPRTLASRSASRGSSDLASVRTGELIDRWSTGSGPDRARIQRELEGRWRKGGVSEGMGALVNRAGRPPVSAAGWRSWWRSVQ